MQRLPVYNRPNFTEYKTALTLLEGVVHVEEREVVAVDVGEAHLGLIRLFLDLVGTHEALRY